MRIKFICTDCGNVHDTDLNKYEKDSIVCKCGKTFDMSHSYPILQANDFAQTANNLFEMCREYNTKNIQYAHDYLYKDGLDYGCDELESYFEVFEKCVSKYPDNNPSKSGGASDDFIDKLSKKFEINTHDSIAIYCAFQVSNRNKFKKPLMVFTASTIEILFNDFFRQVVYKKLGTKGGEIFLNKHEYAGIQECLSICDAFLKEPLNIKMNGIRKGFYDRWSTLRIERNYIIHDNSKYITMTKVHNNFKLVDEAIHVFSILKGLSYSGDL